MKRKLLSLLLVLAMVLAIFPVSAFASDAKTEGGYTYVIEDGYAVITQYTGSDATVNIPETLGGYPVVVIDDGAFCNNQTIKTVNIPDTIERIGMGAFMHCENLAEVNFTGYFAELDEEAFAYCTSLTAFEVPYTGVLRDGLFEGCKNLVAVLINEGNYAIENGAFSGCESLQYMYIPTSMEVIYTDDFKSIKDVVVAGVSGYKELSVGQTFAESMGYTFKSEDYPKDDEAVFTDVDGQQYYSLPVLWAATTGVTTGKTETEFMPNVTCNRAEMITFIWRFCGKPEPDYTKANPFTDVAEGEYYYDAVLWGYQVGIIKGITDTEFWPYEKVNRAMAVTMLQRLDGEPKATKTDTTFTDVTVGDYYYDALLWADEACIAKGMTETEFQPETACSRGMIVTFLYRNLYEFYRYNDPCGNFVA